MEELLAEIEPFLKGYEMKLLDNYTLEEILIKDPILSQTTITCETTPTLLPSNPASYFIQPVMSSAPSETEGIEEVIDLTLDLASLSSIQPDEVSIFMHPPPKKRRQSSPKNLNI